MRDLAATPAWPHQVQMINTSIYYKRVHHTIKQLLFLLKITIWFGSFHDLLYRGRGRTEIGCPSGRVHKTWSLKVMRCLWYNYHTPMSLMVKCVWLLGIIIKIRCSFICCNSYSVNPFVCPSVRKLVRTISRHRLELESPNLHQTCVTEYPQLKLKMEVIDIDLQGHFGHFD